ncbi:hypothetical protein EJ04DRAFT_499695 [Polyplosphaeria fusca]|uniref:Transmembrane protein n=1 Tax=Polyplosphaeria fusca TaxID=682080 RepID=A0A9P4UY07_9PLEO|nr:hypothetical protein EJ04DRAFT_499695 [Polyplosphaeria fusca]
MGAGQIVLAGLRTLVLLVALAVIGLGAWVQHTVHDVEVRGEVVIEMIAMPAAGKDKWQAFFDAVLGSEMRVWIAIGGGCFAFIAGMLVLLSSKVNRLKVSCYVLVPLELLSMITMAGAFTASLSLAVKLDSSCNGLDASTSGDLMAFGMLCPLSKGWSISGGIGVAVLAITSLTALIDLCRHRSKHTCSFEPTASALGMGHGYQAVVPPLARGDIPTLYDPRKPIPGTPARPPREDEIGLADAGAPMGVQEPGFIDQHIDAVSQISGPLGLEKPETVRQMRPARPWSEAPGRKN